MTQYYTCSECLVSAALIMVAKDQTHLCAECASLYFVNCNRCKTLIPKDEALLDNELFVCNECPSMQEEIPTNIAQADAIPEAELALLVDEFIQLHAEEKQIKERMEEIKERLKTIAQAKDRVSNTVVLKSSKEQEYVKCSFSQSYKVDQERIAELQKQLDEAEFQSLFKMEVKYSLIKERIEELLTTSDDNISTIRETILSYIEKVETTILKPYKPR
jgi:hypothetical protein